MGWIIPALQSLQNRAAAHLKIVCHFTCSGGHVMIAQ